ncbi:MAG: fluoride efflux transporter CrcB [Planctomycetota bacterium]
MNQIFAVAVGGALGAVCRHLVNQVCSRYQFPFGTLTVNIVGCFFIGLLITMRASDDQRWDELTHSALTIGFLGALTTFSTFGFETHSFLSSQQHGLGLLNIASNMLLGLVAVYGGIECGRWLS